MAGPWVRSCTPAGADSGADAGASTSSMPGPSPPTACTTSARPAGAAKMVKRGSATVWAVVTRTKPASAAQQRVRAVEGGPDLVQMAERVQHLALEQVDVRAQRVARRLHAAQRVGGVVVQAEVGEDHRGEQLSLGPGIETHAGDRLHAVRELLADVVPDHGERHLA